MQLNTSKGRINSIRYMSTYPAHLGIRFQALTPRSNDNRWAKRADYLRDAPRLELDPEEAAKVTEDLEPKSEILQVIDNYVDHYDAAHRAERLFMPGDGL